MARRSNLEVLAFGRFLFQQTVQKHFGAPPAAGPSEIKHSHIKLDALSKNTPTNT